MSNKKKYTIACLGIIVALVLLVAAILSTRGVAALENPIEGLNYDRSQILVTGVDYQLNYEQEQEIEKEQEEKEKLEEEQENVQVSSEKGQSWTAAAPGAGENQSGGQGGESGEGEGENNSGESEEIDPSMLPVITTSAENGETLPLAYYGFNVRAVDYKGKSISRQFFDVYVNGQKTYSSGSNDYVANYSFDIVEGQNTISIKVTDIYGNVATKTVVLNGSSSEVQVPEGTVTISVDGSNLGLGYIVPPTEITVYKNEKIANVMVRLFREKGISYTNTGTVGYGFYLSRIYLPGITNGWRIPDAIQAGLDSEGVTVKPYETDSLGEDDFYQYSGWMYTHNEEIHEVGSSSIIAMDGDEINIWFTTYLGKDYGGVWNYN